MLGRRRIRYWDENGHGHAAYVYAILCVFYYESVASYGRILFGVSAEVAQAARVEHGWDDVSQAANSLLAIYTDLMCCRVECVVRCVQVVCCGF